MGVIRQVIGSSARAVEPGAAGVIKLIGGLRAIWCAVARRRGMTKLSCRSSSIPT